MYENDNTIIIILSCFIVFLLIVILYQYINLKVIRKEIVYFKSIKDTNTVMYEDLIKKNNKQLRDKELQIINLENDIHQLKNPKTIKINEQKDKRDPDQQLK